MTAAFAFLVVTGVFLLAFLGAVAACTIADWAALVLRRRATYRARQQHRRAQQRRDVADVHRLAKAVQR